MDNALGELNNFATGHQIPSPEYKEVRVTGEPHKRTFTTSCKFSGLIVQCEGKSKSEARKACAVAMVGKMKEEGYLPAEVVDYDTGSDSISLVQQLLQKHGHPLPSYDLVGQKMVGFSMVFTMKASASDLHGNSLSEPCEATASSKKKAKKNAAAALLSKLSSLLAHTATVKQTQFSGDTDVASVHTGLGHVHITESCDATNTIDGSHDDIHIDDPIAYLAAMVTSPQYQYIAGEEDQTLCLVTANHRGDKQVTGCGLGHHNQAARTDAARNLLSNLLILFPQK